MNNKNIIIAVLTTIIATFLILAIIGMSDDKTTTTKSKVDSNEIINSNFRSGFVDGCMEEEATYKQCNCAYDTLEDTYGKQGMLELVTGYFQTGEIADEYITTILPCLE